MRPLRGRLACILFAASVMMSVGGWGQDVVTMDFPLKEAPAALPVGLAEWAKETNNGLATIEIPLLSLNDDGCILVSVIFEDDETRVIHARWIGPNAESTVLAPNLSDGIRGLNQRTFKIPYDLLQADGRLILESEAEIQPVRRIALAWTWASGVYMSAGAQAVGYIPSEDKVLTEKDLQKSADGIVPDTWSAGIWRAYLQEKVESLDQSLEFTVPMDAVPRAIAFRAKILGFPMGAAPVLWVNGRNAGVLSLEVPALTRTGYLRGADGVLAFAGWRTAEVLIPSEYLQAGDNAIVLAEQPGGYISEACLELSFEDEGAPLDLEGSPSEPIADEIAGDFPSGQISHSPSIEPVVIVSPPGT